MSTSRVQNILCADVTGYTRRSRLEARLQELFQTRIAVTISNDRFVFYAPRLVTQDEIDDLREDYRVR